jgi:hypothetical protein
MRIWLNQGLVDASDTDISSDGWPNGEGIFETIRTQNGEVLVPPLGRLRRKSRVRLNSRVWDVRSSVHGPGDFLHGHHSIS